MHSMVMVLILLSSSLFPSVVDRAFDRVEHRDWHGAAQALDQAATDDPASFLANNLPYLRGRIAENLFDWTRARTEFARIPASNSLGRSQHGIRLWPPVIFRNTERFPACWQNYQRIFRPISRCRSPASHRLIWL